MNMPAILGGLLNSWADQEDDSRLTDSTCSATPGRPAMIAANATAETDVSKLSVKVSAPRMIRFVLSAISVNLYNDQTRCFVDRMGKYFSSLLKGLPGC